MNLTLEAGLTIGIALKLLALSLPLVWRKVPMNDVYGFRLAAAFKSERHWYEINAAGGKIMVAAILPVLALGVAKLFVPVTNFVYFNWATLVLSLSSGGLMYYRHGRKNFAG